METVRGTAVRVNGRGVLLRGPSGSGKSDLALRLIDRGGLLISDDYVATQGGAEQVFLKPPEAIAGLIELRGAGLAKIDYVSEVPLVLVVELVPDGQVERLPEPDEAVILGHKLPLLRLEGLTPSAPVKLEMAVAVASGELELVR